MTFLKISYLPYVTIGAILFLIILFFLNRNYFKWIYTYWFFERTWANRVSVFFYSFSLILFLIALLDLRGPEEKVSANLPDQKTIIILDSSASMLAEDIRPSRFAKAVQLSRHFVKKAAAHQIAIVLFSDVQKRLIPFTDDVDLLDSRLSALEKNNAVSGGSNISQAIAEAVSYFSTDGNSENAVGNILVFTDAEESEDKFPLKLGSKINLAVVGLGTARGAPIPLRWDDGSFRGYKTSKGEQVVTKLDENYIKSLGKDVASYKYWIANSYSLPTDEILNFFKGNYNKMHGQGNMTIRPVLSFYIIIPAIFFFILSVIIGRFATLKRATLTLIFLLGSFSLEAQTKNKNEEKKDLPLSVQQKIAEFKKGSLNKSEILKLGEDFLKNERPKEALQVYNEYKNENDSLEVKFNYATALLENKKIKEALPVIKDVLLHSKNEDQKNRIRSNLLLALKKQEDKTKEDKEDKEEQKDKDQNQDQEDKKDGKGQNDKKEGDDQSEDGKSDKSSDGKPSDKNDKNNKEQKSDSPDKNEPEDLKAPPRESKPQSLEEKEKQVEQQRKMIKTPAMVKQILDDDRDLQRKMMDTSTNANSKNKRDW